MTPSSAEHSHGSDHAEGNLVRQELTQKQLADLDNPDRQEEYRKAYLFQVKRQSCPGCGDDGSPF